jgi:hypothetical protein
LQEDLYKAMQEPDTESAPETTDTQDRTATTEQSITIGESQPMDK